MHRSATVFVIRLIRAANYSNSTIGRGGFTFVQSELGQRAPGGFSPWRWLYSFHETSDKSLMLCPASRIQAHADGSNEAIVSTCIVFLAKLASTRIVNDRLCQIALVLFRNTFESERPLGKDAELRRCFESISAQSLIQHSAMSVVRNGRSFQTGFARSLWSFFVIHSSPSVPLAALMSRMTKTVAEPQCAWTPASQGRTPN
jgi:hypothetical protein